MSTTKVDPKIRQVAVLLASVDTQSSRKLLSQLPTAQAKQVRHAMVNLGKVTPEERRQALAMFQRMNEATGEGSKAPTQRRSSPAESALAESGYGVDSVELSDSAYREKPPKKEIDFENSKDVYRAPSSSETDGSDAEHQWHQMDCHDLSELLVQERPIVVAVVLNQIPVPLAASLLQLLPSTHAMAAVAILPRLQSTPNDILKEIHQHLHQRITDYQLPKKSSEQSLKKLQAILDVAQLGFRDACMKNIVKHEPMIARKLGWVVPPDTSIQGKVHAELYSSYPPQNHLAMQVPGIEGFPSPAEHDETQEADFNPAIETIKSDSNQEEDLGDSDLGASDSGPPDILPFRQNGDGPKIRMSFDELGTLPIADLAAVLKSSDPTVILLAISGASESFYRKVQSMLHPKDVKRLDAKLSHMGPIQLRDIERAQRQLCEHATKLLTTGQIGSLVSMTITAAA